MNIVAFSVTEGGGGAVSVNMPIVHTQLAATTGPLQGSLFSDWFPHFCRHLKGENEVCVLKAAFFLAQLL